MPTKERVADWRARLAAALHRHERQPFSWGQSDCFLMAMDAAEAITGIDPYADERGKYRSAVGAARRLKRRGFDSPEEALAAVADTVPRPAIRAGDIAVVDDNQGGEALVISIGRCLHGKSPSGILRLPLSAAKRAYRFR